MCNCLEYSAAILIVYHIAFASTVARCNGFLWVLQRCVIVFLQNLARRCVGIGSFHGIFCFQSTVCGRLGGVLCAFALRVSFFPKDNSSSACWTITSVTMHLHPRVSMRFTIVDYGSTYCILSIVVYCIYFEDTLMLLFSHKARIESY